MYSLGLVSCGSKGAVSVTASVANLTVAIDAASSLAAQVKGGFDLQLALGEYASQGTNVTLSGNFQLVRPADQSLLLLLDVHPSAMFPYHLEPGGKGDVHFTIGEVGAPGQVVPEDVRSALCQAGSVTLAGAISDTASGAQTPLGGPSVAVSGCSP